MNTDSLLILEKLNSFYSGAMSQLVAYTIGIIAFVGILFPAIIAYLQSRQIKREQDVAYKQLSSDLEKAKKELSDSLNTRFQAEDTKLKEGISEIRKEIAKERDRLESYVTARTNFLQGDSLENREVYGVAASEFAQAARNFLTVVDEVNIQRSIKRLHRCLEHAGSDDFGDESDLEEELDKLIAALTARNENDRYFDEIRAIKASTKAAKSRKPSKG